MINPAPIILFAFNRRDKVELCIKSLKQCDLSTASDLIIYSDNAIHPKDISKVEEVRSYLKSVDGFRSVKLIYREKNYGVDYNIIEAIKEVAEQYEQFIFIEDDLTFAYNFIVFMNAALDYYKNNNDVITVTGFSYIKDTPTDYPYDVYFTNRPGSWGWASWASKMKHVDWEIEDADEFLSNSKIRSEFNKWGSDLSPMLKKTLNKEIRAWDIRLCYYQFKHNLYSLFPTKSFVTYNGYGDDASNTSGYNRYKTYTQNNKSTYIFPDQVINHPDIKRRFVFHNSIFMRAKARLFSMLNIN